MTLTWIFGVSVSDRRVSGDGSTKRELGSVRGGTPKNQSISRVK